MSNDILERSEIPDVPQAPGSPAPPALPHAETLLDPLIDYPVLTTQNGPLEEVVACFGMLAKFFDKEFPKEPARRVLSNEVPADRQTFASRLRQYRVDVGIRRATCEAAGC
jgi:hypothetical protein